MELKTAAIFRLVVVIVGCQVCSATLTIPAGPLVGRKCSEHAANRQPSEPFTPKCNPDGTYAPTQFNTKSGLKFCVSKEGIMLVAPQRSLSDCDCPRKRFEKFQNGTFEGFIFRCDTDFTYSVQQYNPETKETLCLMKDGEVINEYRGEQIKACKCPRQWYEAKISPLPNRYGPQCNTDGTFKPQQCHKGKCWCANGEGEQISSQMVPESDAGTLDCQPI
ncbi:U24-ctenitoxin-Pn1a-like [Paramacrobiotus metropolitanus]|uniref:U24-ctenitoxin-Pn1a-like n=1 Tax=Paramacrobiotus metropolitanus TaxID=2943436 RepID=UPI002445B2CB|nr:U24-ctenitoxin-Pn1a-like [Paramacrobiotus metropolitanus]